MRTVTLTINGQIAQLGQLSMSNTQRLWADGLAANTDDFNNSTSNAPETPSAPEGTGLLASTRIATPHGPRRIDEIAVGDIVLDTHGTEATVRHVLRAPTPRDAFFLRAPYFGLDQDTVLAPHQKMVVTSDIAEYLFGDDTVIVPVWALNDGRKVVHHETRSSDLMYQLQLDTSATLAIGDCAISALHKENTTKGRVLSEAEARCFAAEHFTGFRN